MAYDREPRRTVVTHRHAFARRRLALPVSIALHAVVVLGAARMDWSTAVSPAVAPTISVVWLESRPPQPELVEALPPTAEPAMEPPIVEEPPEPPPKPAPIDEQPEPEAAPAEPARSAVAEEASEAAPAPPAPRPQIDWEAERRRAAASVIEERGSETYRSFSTEDLPERKPAGDATPPTPIAEVMDDGCVIAKNRFERMMMMMLGRCVREARGDLFADAMPSYLTKRPVCVETRPEGVPAVESASGREYPTVKCRMEDPDEE